MDYLQITVALERMIRSRARRVNLANFSRMIGSDNGIAPVIQLALDLRARLTDFAAAAKNATEIGNQNCHPDAYSRGIYKSRCSRLPDGMAKQRRSPCRSLVCSKSHRNSLIPVAVFAWRRAQRGVMQTPRLTHDRRSLGTPRPFRSLVRVSPVWLRPNSRLSYANAGYARIRKAGMSA